MTYSDKLKLHEQLKLSVQIWSNQGPVDFFIRAQNNLIRFEKLNREINYLAMWAGTDSTIENLEKQLAELQQQH